MISPRHVSTRPWVSLEGRIDNQRGTDPKDLGPFLRPYHADMDTFRRAENASIRMFLENNKHLLQGPSMFRVLDFGCGKPGTCRQPQPYRDLIKGQYVGVDVGDPDPEGYFDAILCTQVLNYFPDGGAHQLLKFHNMLNPYGWLVCTYATNWEVIEEDDLCRLTQNGMNRALTAAGFNVVEHDLRFELKVDNFRIPIGYGFTAKAMAPR